MQKQKSLEGAAALVQSAVLSEKGAETDREDRWFGWVEAISMPEESCWSVTCFQEERCAVKEIQECVKKDAEVSSLIHSGLRLIPHDLAHAQIGEGSDEGGNGDG